MKKWKMYWLEVERFEERKSSSLWELMRELGIDYNKCIIHFNDRILFVLPFNAPQDESVMRIGTLIKALKLWDKDLREQALSLEKLIKQLKATINDLKLMFQSYYRPVIENEETATRSD